MTYEEAYGRAWVKLRNAEINRSAPSIVSPTGKKTQTFRNRVRRLMADGRERTAADVSCAVRCSLQQAHNALTSLRLNGELASAYVAELTVFRAAT